MKMMIMVDCVSPITNFSPFVTKTIITITFITSPSPPPFHNPHVTG